MRALTDTDSLLMAIVVLSCQMPALGSAGADSSRRMKRPDSVRDFRSSASGATEPSVQSRVLRHTA
ncbi:hypothetical protein PF005_g6810 [Phytophthora fragariae]|uniref:RxLR effector protein n=1 Tax=Phytophthora fragariae TaxID=53985 RepID=A0A6A4AX73_9STRA|nr:hypothetical protein PF003_g9944 [Phytophthora fragariae]KAE8945339.1 hypothetical protein PF009_g4996 [Phytophthora fragariae]KAE8959397.1 hypothetical protein PF011_g30446 [Phytophthora fragariae]KAE9059201.1 hypothetical protein PF010_g30715 [Phytophthora fragariae]KAE9083478.1 hypothetical protein PF007_g21881 [Phytophthora fragariae]